MKAGTTLDERLDWWERGVAGFMAQGCGWHPPPPYSPKRKTNLRSAVESTRMPKNEPENEPERTRERLGACRKTLLESVRALAKRPKAKRT
jgi:hypothetical protein